MTIPRPRNGAPETVRAGDRRRGGQVWATPRRDNPEQVAVGVVGMVGQAVDVTWDDIETFRDGLTKMLHDAGRE